MKKFAALLGKYIEASGMKQTYVASTTHISYNYLLRLLAGDRHPSEQVVFKLAETMRLSKKQTGELLAVAGYAPPESLMEPIDANEQDAESLAVLSTDMSKATRFVQQFYRLAQEVPELLQEAFLGEMRHLLGYARYKYVLSGGVNPIDLNRNLAPVVDASLVHDMPQQEQIHLNLIAQLVGEWPVELEEESAQHAEETPLLLEEKDVPSITNETIRGMPIEEHPSQFVEKILTVLQDGASWDIRSHITKAFSGLYRLDISGTEKLMSILRLDRDEVHGADIRRRVVEALPTLFEASPFSLSTIISLLNPVADDDIYVALATVEVCGDIQVQIKHLLERSLSGMSKKKTLEFEQTLLRHHQADIAKIQRQLLQIWTGVEREYIQFSMTLHDLLPAPDTLLLSLQEGLHSLDKMMQLVSARYLERLILIKPLEALEMYKYVLQEATSRNVRRTVAKALPHLLHCLIEASLSVRALARTVISSLATDPDIYIRRAVADYAMQLFHVDREFLLVVLREMHKDKDQAVRSRLQPVVLRLAQLWLISYAETAGLIGGKLTRRTRKDTQRPITEMKPNETT